MACLGTPDAATPIDSARDAPVESTSVGEAPGSAAEAPALDPTTLPCLRVARLEVRKRERVLEAFCEEGGRRVFGIALSREPVGAKARRGDQRIPEGDYRIAGGPRASRFRLFIPIDYPSLADADQGYATGLIPRADYRQIVAAHASGRMPPQDTRLGGGIGFHGEGPRWRGDLDLDWTEGCIAVADETIHWLASHAPIGTPVAIRP